MTCGPARRQVQRQGRSNAGRAALEKFLYVYFLFFTSSFESYIAPSLCTVYSFQPIFSEYTNAIRLHPPFEH